jgi:glycosidase
MRTEHAPWSVRQALALRHTNEALLEGSYAALNEDDANVMSYLPSYKGKAVLVALNRNLPLKLSM